MVTRGWSLLKKLSANWVARVVFTVVVLTLLYVKVEIATVVHTLTNVGVGAISVVFAIYFLKRYILAYQMSLGLNTVNMQFSINELFTIRLISTFYALIVPGDLVAGGAAWYKLSRRDAQAFEAGALIVYFRLINTLTLLAIGLVGAWLDPRFGSTNLRVVIAAMFAGVVVLSLPFFLSPVTRVADRVSHRLMQRLSVPPWLANKLHLMWKIFTAFQSLSAKTVLSIVGLSLLSQLMGVAVFYLFATAVDIHLSLFVIGWVRSLLIIIQMIPITIAGLGVREASLVFLLGGYGIPETQALSYSLAIFSVTIVAGIVGGLFEGWDVLSGRRRNPDTARQAETNTTTAQ